MATSSIVVAAVLVQAPRLCLALAEGDGVVVPTGVRGLLLAGSAGATAVVLTVGGALLAKAAAAATGRGRWLLLALVGLVLASVVVQVAPLVVLQLGSSSLGEILAEPWQRWAFAVTSALAVELVVLGLVLAEQLRAQLPSSAQLSSRAPELSSALELRSSAQLPQRLRPVLRVGRG
jgi:hypothetical protein